MRRSQTSNQTKGLTMPKPKTVSELLERARDLLSDSDRWIKRNYFRRRGNKPAQYCAVGALIKARGDSFKEAQASGFSDQVWDARNILSKQVRKTSIYLDIITFNDNPFTTHKDLMKVFDEAIKEAKMNKEWDSKYV